MIPALNLLSADLSGGVLRTVAEKVTDVLKKHDPSPISIVDHRQDLLGLLAHERRVAAALHVEPEQGLGVALPQVEAPEQGIHIRGRLDFDRAAADRRRRDTQRLRPGGGQGDGESFIRFVERITDDGNRD